jgi:hypothetical protein
MRLQGRGKIARGQVDCTDFDASEAARQSKVKPLALAARVAVNNFNVCKRLTATKNGDINLVPAAKHGSLAFEDCNKARRPRKHWM